MNKPLVISLLTGRYNTNALGINGDCSRRKDYVSQPRYPFGYIVDFGFHGPQEGHVLHASGELGKFFRYVNAGHGGWDGLELSLGLGSKVCCWLGPPSIHRRMQALPRGRFIPAWAMDSNHGTETPESRPAEESLRKSRLWRNG